MNVTENFKEEFERTYGHKIQRGNLQASLTNWDQTGGAA
jgi:hypothetical protein